MSIEDKGIAVKKEQQCLSYVKWLRLAYVSSYFTRNCCFGGPFENDLAIETISKIIYCLI